MNVVRLKLKAPRENFIAVARECVAFSDTEPGTLTYDWFLAPDGETCDVVMSYVNAEAHAAHVGSRFGTDILPKLLAVADVIRSDIYGELNQFSTEFLKDRDRIYHGAPLFVAGTRRNVNS